MSTLPTICDTTGSSALASDLQDIQSVWVYDPWCFTPWYTASLAQALKNEVVALRLVCPRYHLEPEYFLSCGVETDPGPIDKVSGWRIQNADARRAMRMAEWSINVTALACQLCYAPPKILHVQQCALINHGFSLEVDFLSWAHRWGTRVLHTVHNLLPHAEAERNRGLYRQLYQICDGLICHSADVSLRLQEEFDIADEKISVIPHGPLFATRPKMSQQECRKELGIKEWCEDDLVFLWQGVMAPYKGLDLLLKAWKSLEERVQGSSRRGKLLIAGTGPESEIRSLMSMVQHLESGGNVRLDIGYIPAARIPLYYQAADVIVYPYREITTSGALMTGLNYQKPIIATRLSAFQALLEDERNALLIPGPTVESLTEALLRLTTSRQLIDKLRFHAQKNPEKQTQWSEIAVRTVRAYRKALQ
ncbi:MAG: glycosyltransferase family 4 protein [Acidobacteriaceae bacterium]